MATSWAGPGAERVREATDADLPAVVALLRRAVDYDTLDADDVALVLAGDPPAGHVTVPARGPTLGVVAGGDASSDPAQGAAYGSIVMGDEGVRTGCVALLAVDPDQRGRGLGRALLAALERRLLDAGAEVLRAAGPAPRYLWPGVDVRATALLCLLESAGYARDGEAVNMTVDLAAADLATDDEGRFAATGVAVRPLAEQDLERFAAFMQRWQAPWHAEAVAATRRGGGASCQVAWRGDEPLGFAAAGGARGTFFGPMGTARQARGTGIGRVLLRRCLWELRDAGHATAEIAWVGPVGFYSRAVGARIERVCWQLAKPAP